MRRGSRRVLAGALAILGVVAATAFAQDAIITGTDGNDTLQGTAAGESIYARGGNDAIDGGAGDDELDGGTGADVLNGGPGSDAVSYSGSAQIVVTLDRTANDGIAGEGDNVGSDVEDIFGSDGPDKLTGGPAANTIDGGAGDDRLTGGAGEDALFAGEGEDVVEARDGSVDRIDCGPGRDVATVDSNDTTNGCERLLRPPVTDAFDLTLRRSQRRLIVGSIDPVSTIELACVSGCHPRSAPTRTIYRRTSVRGPLTRIPLTSRVSGATLEIGVTRRGARTRCVRFRIGRGFAAFRVLRGVGCTTTASSLGS